MSEIRESYHTYEEAEKASKRYNPGRVCVRIESPMPNKHVVVWVKSEVE